MRTSSNRDARSGPGSGHHGDPVTAEPDPTDAFAGERVRSGDAGSTTLDYDPLATVAHKGRLSPGTRNAVEWAVVIIGAVVITVLLRTFAFQTFYIPSESMVPTLQVGDRIVVNK